MTINKQIHTTLQMKEVAYVTSGLHNHIERIGDSDPELKKELESIINRLGRELYDYPTEDHTIKDK